MHILRYLSWENGRTWLNGSPLFEAAGQDAPSLLADAYAKLKLDYPKFFKMDLLSKTALLATECLAPFEGKVPDRNALVLSTAEGSFDADLRFEQSRKEIASPALFVYTLPNIMLGEVCIKHGFKGEQMCTVSDNLEVDNMVWAVEDLLSNREMDYCLLGHIDATGNQTKALLAWIGPYSGTGPRIPLNTRNLQLAFTRIDQ